MAEERDLRRAPLPTEAGDENIMHMRANTSNPRIDERQDILAASEHAGSSQHRGMSATTLVVRTHDGDGYVLPYLPWETTKLQIENIYKLKGRESLAEAIKNDTFTMLTEGGDIILPTLWDSVVSPSAVLQLSIPPDILNPDIASGESDEYIPGPGHRRFNPSIAHSADEPLSSGRDEPLILGREEPLISGGEEPKGISEETNDGIDGTIEELSIDETTSESELSDGVVPAEVTIEPPRTTHFPSDDEGNKLSFQINTAVVGPQNQSSDNVHDTSMKRKPQQSLGDVELLSITKAVSTQAEGRNILQICVLPGPRSAMPNPDVSVRWYHLHSERLDIARFKDVCLGISGLSDRLRELTKKLFERIERDKLKAFLAGMFLEPGTVLRADESHQPDPQSAIFSCIPYFDLQTAAKYPAKTGKADRGFPARTLMQSYYPYEPVRERDAEQAYRVFGNERSDALVHVPNLWMVNIGPTLVVTCGHQALSKGLVQSIEVFEATRNHTKVEGLSQDPPTSIRLTDWDGHTLLYSVGECRSYFQMEQKLRELQYSSNNPRTDRSLDLSWRTPDNNVKVTPGIWSGIIKRRDSLFIDLVVSNSEKETDKRVGPSRLSQVTASSPIPFFCWPQTKNEVEQEVKGLITADTKHSVQCLEQVERAMLSEVLSSYGSYGPVEKAFTSNAYYRALDENTVNHVKSIVESLISTNKEPPNPGATSLTIHQALIGRQHRETVQKTSELSEVFHGTLKLFVADVEKNTLLRKSWGATANVCSIAATICSRTAMEPDPEEYSNPDWTHPSLAHRGWFIRPSISDKETTDTSKKLKRTFEKCKKCRTNKMYRTPQAALLHLQKHLENAGASNMSGLIPEQWIVNYAQLKMETWNEGFLDILTKACEIAQELFSQAKEVSDGVRNEDGQMSDLYTFPLALLDALRQLLVFYYAVERALHHTEDAYQDKINAFDDPEYMTTVPFSTDGLHVLNAFGNGAQQAIGIARLELCSMVKSTEPVNILSRLSLSPEYVCSWFMRRLMVKPLEKSMTLSDMYREYLSTVQFQVNHRPSKRLLRSINLLEEELMALLEINTQQSKLVANYMRVLDEKTYEKPMPTRRAMFRYENQLLESCQDSLQLTDQEYRYLLARCGPLSNSTKQSLEINEEDHGKAIMVFTIVTIIFLPLSFVTSFLGMNTTDIRDMGSSSWLFWAIAVPLTSVTMGSVLYIGYNGDELRDTFSSLYRIVAGKQDRSTSARGISIAQQKRARKFQPDSNSSIDFTSLADEAEYANPQPEDYYRTTYRAEEAEFGEDEWPSPPRRHYAPRPSTMQWAGAPEPVVPNLRTSRRAQTYSRPMPISFDRPNAVHYSSPPLRRIRPQASEVAPYEWAKKSRKHNRSGNDRTRFRRDDWDPSDEYDRRGYNRPNDFRR